MTEYKAGDETGGTDLKERRERERSAVSPVASLAGVASWLQGNMC